MPRGGSQRQASHPLRKEDKGSPLDWVPDELLLLVFEQLAKLGPEQSEDAAQTSRVRRSPAQQPAELPFSVCIVVYPHPCTCCESASSRTGLQ